MQFRAIMVAQPAKFAKDSKGPRGWGIEQTSRRHQAMLGFRIWFASGIPAIIIGRVMKSCNEPSDAGPCVRVARKSVASSSSPRTLIVWIWLCAGLNLAGWALSAIRQLNAAGYIMVLLVSAVGFFLW